MFHLKDLVNDVHGSDNEEEEDDRVHSAERPGQLFGQDQKTLMVMRISEQNFVGISKIKLGCIYISSLVFCNSLVWRFFFL